MICKDIVFGSFFNPLKRKKGRRGEGEKGRGGEREKGRILF
jgi:hypothetical protein